MTTANYSVQIGAPKKAVWEAMIDREKYSIWTKPFSENSSFIGEWREDAEIQFVDAGNGGTLALIETFRPHDLMVLKHIGLIIKEGKVEKSGHENWIGTLETILITCQCSIRFGRRRCRVLKT